MRDKFFYEDICVYMDNLSVHRSREVRDRMDELSIPYIFSPPYSPDYNPIEMVFSMLEGQKISCYPKRISNKYIKEY